MAGATEARGRTHPLPGSAVAGAGAVPTRLRRWGMNALYGAITVVLAPYALARVLTDPKTRARWRAYAKDLPARYHRRHPRPSASPCVWVHGVSVGEVKSVARLIEALEAAYPNVEILVSVSTDTGRRVAVERYPGHRIEFYPPDLSWIVQDALDALRPDMILLVESGFWPTFLGQAHERDIPVVVVNGRMSAKSAARFGLVRMLIEPVLSTLAAVCVQLDAYGARFRALGVPADRVHVTGNMKLDNIPPPSGGPGGAALARLLAAWGAGPLLVAGSTHPTEERALGRMHRRLSARGLPLRLLVAPRHPARAPAVEAQLRRDGRNVVRRTRLDAGAPLRADDVVLLDTVGELEAAYTLADLVFVGGTLVKHGGQNMMEPASLGRPVVVGPYVDNFQGEVDLLLASEGLVVAPDEAGVEATLAQWLSHPDEAAALGQRARQAILAGKGATERTLAVLRPHLEAVIVAAAALRGRRRAPQAAELSVPAAPRG